MPVIQYWWSIRKLLLIYFSSCRTVHRILFNISYISTIVKVTKHQRQNMSPSLVTSCHTCHAACRSSRNWRDLTVVTFIGRMQYELRTRIARSKLYVVCLKNDFDVIVKYLRKKRQFRHFAIWTCFFYIAIAISHKPFQCLTSQILRHKKIATLGGLQSARCQVSECRMSSISRHQRHMAAGPRGDAIKLIKEF